MQSQVSTLTQKGQVTIPILIRKRLALEPGAKVSFVLEEGAVKLYPAPNFFDFRGSVSSKKPFNIKKMRKAAKKHLALRHDKTA